MQYNPAQYGQAPQQNIPDNGQINKTSFGQQFTNQPSGGYTGQQFTNQPAQNVPANGKKGMSTGKIVGLVLGIVGAVILILGIIFGVAACNFMNTSKNLVDNALSSYEDYYDDYDDYNDWLYDLY